MRSHGVPIWLGSSVNSEGQPGFKLVPSGVNADSLQVKIAINECQRLLPPSSPGGSG
jgi:hypothetical protein